MMLQRRLPAFAVLIAAVVALAGCTKGNPNAPAKVKGKVTYKGSAVGAGTVVFHSKDAGNSTFALGSDGSFEGSDLPTGEMKITVETESANPDKKQVEYKGGKSARPGGGAAGPKDGKAMQMSPMPKDFVKGGGQYVKIPAKYADEKSSGLSVTLSSGNNVKDVELAD